MNSIFSGRLDITSAETNLDPQPGAFKVIGYFYDNTSEFTGNNIELNDIVVDEAGTLFKVTAYPVSEPINVTLYVDNIDPDISGAPIVGNANVSRSTSNFGLFVTTTEQNWVSEYVINKLRNYNTKSMDQILYGVQSAQGPQGFDGTQGPAGVQGVAGSQGNNGPQGLTGSQGNNGAQGNTGPQGLAGMQGFTGVQGSTGVQGVAGVQGLTGYSSLNKWFKLTDFADSGTGRRNAMSTSYNGKIYVGTGYSAGVGYTKDWYEYDNNSDVWTQKADFPVIGQYKATSASNGKIYAGIGFDGSAYVHAWYEYDISSNTWTRKADFPNTSNRNAPVAASIDGRVFAGTGNTGTPQKDWYEYDIATDTWTRKADFPIGIYDASAVGYNGKIYVGVGLLNNTNTVGYTNAWYEYDISSDVWTQKAALPGNERGQAVAAIVNDKIYAGTGYFNGGGYTNTWYEYDIATDVWTQKVGFLGGARNYNVAASANGRVYIGTGYAYMTSTIVKDWYDYIP
jgi:N-acetylneuraminic acid mutarotase